ncbi:MAG: hypothetical protein A2842_02520 [Candidatus Wildermuthbacteria bacterium RIFCSPHIGHO2_01_FULL_48_25]|uniref:histidine kinase n=1 Tax=Candidatus Wildermuthbacteria bacterium RIFCSPLOWO2_01_FULL_48_16 TaxID=1802461 RepID=A0A1G2RJE5_9BACT|nr:MAG: hypothetical protein A2842_02520 [Candidatus Wildermuthbacteria bacterium RIFCSPHIGHO2_01_FULL_48_25]OHA69181.1 MAG: hypothetical protein A3J57_02540 [Candidatus Wildermuthbacteria bacterium RIFCSPHIGHO2_02_FULL_49_12b]OHA72907.1 MAG: hypothetical protein A3B24_03370 [Candidatus Wildermuthbacteria bacterium RIFCSPLOWO2_01_FULL_48_16]
MNVFALSGILIGTTSTAMAVLMILIGKEKLHHIWGLFCTAVAVWGFGAYQIATTSNIAQAELWWRITHLGVIFIPILFMHFVSEFLKLKNKPFIVSLYTLGFLFLALNAKGDLFIASMRWVFNQFYYDSPPGIFYIPFTFFFIGLVILSHYILWRALRTATGLKKKQIQYFFAGMLVSFAGGSLSFLPVYGIDFYPIFNLFAFLYTPILTFAILRKQLFDIRLVLTQFLVGAIAILLLFNFFTSSSFFEYAWKGTLFVAFLLAGYLLIKSVLNEIRIREQLEEALTKLKELDKAKSEFLSIASHQLRAPLTAIKGYLSMLMEGTYGTVGEQQKRPMQNVYDSNERMIKLVNDLLNISRIESGKVEMKMEEGSVEKILESVVQELQVKAHEKRLDLVFEKPQSPLSLFRFDKEKMRNVVLNLVDNAIHYTEQGSVKVQARQTAQNTIISVTDTGLGMREEEIARLFQSFTRGETGNRAWAEGSGLGLYIAKQFVALHRGRIWAESKGQGKGSTFFVELPLA